MADDQGKAGAPAPTRINPAVEAELHEWARRLDTTVEQLREAVAAVGDQAADVEMHLKGTRATTNADQELRGERGNG